MRCFTIWTAMGCDGLRQERSRHERFLLVQTTPFNLFKSRASRTSHRIASHRRSPVTLPRRSRPAGELTCVCVGVGYMTMGFGCDRSRTTRKEAVTRDSFSFRRRHSISSTHAPRLLAPGSRSPPLPCRAAAAIRSSKCSRWDTRGGSSVGPGSALRRRGPWGFLSAV